MHTHVCYEGGPYALMIPMYAGPNTQTHALVHLCMVFYMMRYFSGVLVYSYICTYIHTYGPLYIHTYRTTTSSSHDSDPSTRLTTAPIQTQTQTQTQNQAQARRSGILRTNSWSTSSSSLTSSSKTSVAVAQSHLQEPSLQVGSQDSLGTRRHSSSVTETKGDFKTSRASRAPLPLTASTGSRHPGAVKQMYDSIMAQREAGMSQMT